MPSFQSVAATSDEERPLQTQFPPVTKNQILHCSYDYWFPKYRSHCIRSRIIPLSEDFVSYLREDGIIQADDDVTEEDEIEWSPSSNTRLAPRPDDSETDSDSDSDAGMNLTPPNQRFPALHQQITDTIAELGGAVAPKLNWSSPKDATFMNANSMKSIRPNDIYVLFKSSNFISHDLDHVFDDCIDASMPSPSEPLPYSPVLVLRKWFNPQPSLEFRCFVKHRTLVGLCQRDRNLYGWLPEQRGAILSRVTAFFNSTLKDSFPDDNYAFDVYIPEGRVLGDDAPLSRVRLIDINPWAPKTDSLLFDWSELIGMQVPKHKLGSPETGKGSTEDDSEATGDESEIQLEEDEDDDDEFQPEVRFIEHGSGQAFNLMSAEYSAHKLPREVVDASQAGPGGMAEFARVWKRMLDTQCRMDDQGGT